MAEKLSWSARLMAAAGLVGVGVAVGLTVAHDVSPELPRAVDDGVAEYVVVHGVTDRSGETSVGLEWARGEVLRAPEGWSGVVTRVSVSPDGLVREGDQPYDIDGVRRVALATSAPLVRELPWGSVGSDVTELRAALERRGLLDAESGGDRPDRVDTEMRDAIAALGESLGVTPRPAVFDPAWVVWIPRPVVEAAPILEVGERAPAAGEPITDGGVWLERAWLTAGAAAAGDHVVSIDGLPAVRVEGSEVHPDDLVELGTSLLAVGADPESSERRFGEMRLATPMPVARLAAASMQTGAERVCVWLADGRLVEVDVVGSQLGVAHVRVVPELPDGARLLADPPIDVRDSC